MNKIEIKNIYKIFGKRPQAMMKLVLKGLGKDKLLTDKGHILGIQDVSLSIKEGEVFVIMGLSGAGKSTLIRHLNRLVDPTSGTIVVDGVDIMKLNKHGLNKLRRHQVSMVFQHFGLLPHRTVEENVATGLLIRGMKRSKALEHAGNFINSVGLTGYEKKYPKHLSGGMKQRVGLARALASESNILLMDEAFSALDPLIRHQMQKQLLELQKKFKKTIVFITHDFVEAIKLGDNIAIMKDGLIRQIGTSSDILLHPADDYIAQFVKNVNVGTVVKVKTIVTKEPLCNVKELLKERLLMELEGSELNVVLVTEAGKIIGGVNHDLVRRKKVITKKNILPIGFCSGEDTINSVLKKIGENLLPLVALDKEGEYLGCVNERELLQVITR